MEPRSGRPDTGGTGPVAPYVTRPYFVSMLEAQPLPALLYGPGGEAIVANAAARRLLVPDPDGELRVLAQDGTDLWTILAARSGEASPFFDVRLRVRAQGGLSLEVALSVAPLHGADGSLGGAVVFVLSMPSERIRPTADEPPQSDDGFTEVLARIGTAVGAARVYVVEVDHDYRLEGTIVGQWAVDGSAMPVGPFGLRGTPSDAMAARRATSIPSGLKQAFPDDPQVQAEDADAYVGVSLVDSAGRPIGVLAGLWREPLHDVSGTLAVFSILAPEATRMLREAIARRELRESEQRYGAVFSGSAVPILLVEPMTTQVVDANPAASRFYGYDHDDLLTMSVLQLDAMTSEALRHELEHALDGSRTRFVGRHLLAGGRVRDVEVSIGPIVVAGRQLLYLMIDDITERRSMEAELERNRRTLEATVAQRTEDLLRANAELQQASMARDMVFVSLSRELRTSLQTITGFSGLLLDGLAGELSGEQRRQIEMIAQAGKRLAAFATSLIETQRAEQRQLVVEPEPFDLVELLESVLFGLVSFAEDKGLRLDLEVAERPLGIITDRYKLQQVLLNLLSNAIRYTERGGVLVSTSRDEAGVFRVSVADTGPGLSADRLDDVFEGTASGGAATGIGLPASRRIATLLGGTIHAESEVGRGSVFTLAIPSMPAVCLPDGGGRADG